MANVKIDGETFRVEVEGDPGRPTVLLSNSLGTDLSLWDAQMPGLTAHFRVIRYDPRGHGRSTSAGAPYSLARLGADALAILDALSIERTHFVGLSMGGAVGQWLLVNAPHRIDRAILANTSARFGTPEGWNTRIHTVLSRGMRSLATATMERWFSDDFRISDADSVAAIDSVFRATSAQGYAAGCAALRDMDMREALCVVDRPVLIVTGRDDPVVSAADLAAMTEAIAGAQHVALDCKHISNIEAQQAFDAAVIAFLTARTPSRASKARGARKPAARRPASRATSARSPLKPAKARPAATARRRPAKTTQAAAKTTRPTTKAASAKAASTKAASTKPRPRKAASKLASARRVPKATARGPVGKVADRSPPAKTTRKTSASKSPTAKTTSSPKTKGIVKTVTAKTPAAKTAVAKKAVAKKSVLKKPSVKKPSVKKPLARRATARTPRRPPGRGKR